jgi:hypothetical protein
MAEREEIDAFLQHHGVKGMHWGVRRNLEKSDNSSGSSGNTESSAKDAASAFSPSSIKSLNAGIENLTDKDKAVLKAAGASPFQAEAMRAKYGPDSSKPDDEKKGLSSAQKKLIIYGAIGLGVAGLVAYSAHAGNAKTLDSLVGGGFEKEAAKSLLKEKPKDAKVLGGLLSSGMKRPAAEYLLASDKQKEHTALKGLTDEALSKFSHEDLSFEPGHVFKRVSTVAEDTIRPDGFFASHNDADTDRYKAVLPTYWKMWYPANPPTSGFVNHLSSDQTIKVASEGTMYNIIKSQLDTPMGVGGSARNKTLRQYLTAGSTKTYSSDDELVQDQYYQMIASFANSNSAVAQKLTKSFKAAGYHGIVDSNDAGSLSAQPVKILDGSIFKLVGNEKLSAQGISDAQDKILALQHYIEFLLNNVGSISMATDDELNAFLEHHGVKGMHWGVRRQAKKDANEFTKAKLAYGQGAGTRRKLINAKVGERSANPDYKSAFDGFVAGQNLSKRATQAKVNNRTKTAVRSTTKTARGVHRSLSGGFGTVSLASAVIAGAYVAAHQSGADKAIMNAASDFIKSNRSQSAAKAWLRSQGVQGV